MEGEATSRGSCSGFGFDSAEGTEALEAAAVGRPAVLGVVDGLTVG